MKKFIIGGILAINALSGNAQDLVSGGINSWIFHTPDDGRQSLELAPMVNGSWSFGKFILSQAGDLNVASVSSQVIRANSWQPFGSASDDLFLDVEPGTRVLRTRNWNLSNPNILATGIHTGSGYFEGNIGIGTPSPISRLQVGDAGISNGTEANLVAVFGSKGSGAEPAALQLNQLWNGHIYSAGLAAYVDPAFGPASVGLLAKTSIWNGAGVSAVNSLYVRPDGFVGVGTMVPQERLSVNGKVRAKEVKVEAYNWPDYVFEDDFELETLGNVKLYIAKNGHLPDMPSASEVKEKGIDLGEMNARLLKKVEELTLHLIRQDEELRSLKEDLLEVQRKVKR